MENTLNTQIENELFDIRAGFATWLTQRHMFSTLALFSQVKLVFAPDQDAIAAISHREQIFIFVNKDFFASWAKNHKLTYFLLMHELRHVSQTKTIFDWDHLINFNQVRDALRSVVPKSLLQESGIGDISDNFDLKHDLLNLAADAAIHEDLVSLFGPDSIKQMDDFLTEQAVLNKRIKIGEDIGLVTVKFLEKLLNTSLEPGKDWLYYSRKMVKHLAERILGEPEFAKLILEKQLLYQMARSSLGAEEFNEEALGKIDLILAKSENEGLRMTAATFKKHAEHDGPAPNDYEEVYKARNELSRAIKTIISLILKSLSVGKRQKYTEKKSFNLPHRFLDGLPGLQRVSVHEPKSDSVIVFDTSGSMWMPEVLNHMASLAYQLTRKHAIKRAYCCDVEIHPIDNVRGGSIKFKGRGGTVWTEKHHDYILKDLNTTNLITIYYFTDEEVLGLEEAKKDTRVKLVVVNLPRLISPNLVSKASL